MRAPLSTWFGVVITNTFLSVLEKCRSSDDFSELVNDSAMPESCLYHSLKKWVMRCYYTIGIVIIA